MSQVVGLDMVTGMGFIGLEPGRLYKIGQSPKLKDQTASGNPLLLNSAEAPLTSLTLYGWSKQDGTPTPDNPVPIVSAGDEGEINVTVQGGNLFDESLLDDENNFDKSLVSSGYWIIKFPVPPGDITVSVGKISNASDTYFAVSNEYGGGNVPRQWFIHSVATNGRKSITYPKGQHDKYIYLYLSGSMERVQRVLSECEYIQVEIGDTATQYEPYKTPQPLTVSTPGGLPGIPVSSGGNYTDESGQQWICDEVDFKRGKYVQRVWKGTFDGSENWSKYGIEGATSNYGFLASNALPEPMNYRNGFCNQYKVAASSILNNAEIWFRFGAGSANATAYAIHVEQYDPSLEDFGLANWKAHLAAHPLEVMTYLETPIETDLSDEEMAAYEALHTHSPATTVSNDAGAWMKVGYKK